MFFEELHHGDLSGCLNFLLVDLLVTFQDILHLLPYLGTSHAVGIMLIKDGYSLIDQFETFSHDLHHEGFNRHDLPRT